MRRNARVLLGVGFVGVGLWSVVPGMVHPTSTDAVVNAEVITVRAPVDGHLGTGLGLAVGDRVAAGEEIARIHALRPESGRRDGLALDLATQRQVLAALTAEDAELASLERELGKRSAAYRSAVGRSNALARAEAEARLGAAEARKQQASAELARKQFLFDKNLVAPPMMESLRAAERAADAEVGAARAARDRLHAEGIAVRRGTMAGGGGDDTSYAGQRRDEVRLKRAARKVDIAQARVRVAELERQATAEAARSDALAQAVLTAPLNGVLWRRFAAEGDAVRAGDPLLGVVDCGKLFLTAVLPKRFFSELKAGDRAKARLVGTDEPVAAVVESVRAAGNAQANAAAAVAPVAEDGRDVVVTLAVRDARLGNRSDNLCQVGQRASVTFQVPALDSLVGAVAAGVWSGGRAS
ncbi:MAG: HlyD family secretion protein [Bacteroidota bacterium]